MRKALGLMREYVPLAVILFILITRIKSEDPYLPLIGTNSWCILNFLVVGAALAILYDFVPEYKFNASCLAVAYFMIALVLVCFLSYQNASIGFVFSLAILTVTLGVLVPISLHSGRVALKRHETIDYFFEDSEWIIAVSRKFHDPDVDHLYFTYILPILRQEGIVLECSYASDDINSIDYWTTRMQVILEISDLHIFLEHVTSPNTQAELEWSKNILSGSSLGQTIRLMFWEESQETPLSGILNGDSNQWGRLVHPYAIRINPHFQQTSFRRSSRIAEVLFDGKSNVPGFESQLRNIIHEAKRRRSIEFFDTYHFAPPNFDWEAALNLKVYLAGNFALISSDADYRSFVEVQQAVLPDSMAKLHLATHKMSELEIKRLQGDPDIWNKYAEIISDFQQEIAAESEGLPRWVGCLFLYLRIGLGFIKLLLRVVAGFDRIFRRALRIVKR